MLVTFWGVRGSIPCPGKDTVRYGGNTTCVEVNLKSGETIIFDTGTGARLLGKKLIQGGILKEKPIVYIFYTHAHWDHIQGFPFFTPAFVPGTKLMVYGENKEKEGLRISLEMQQEYPNFPVKFSDMPAEIHFNNIKEYQSITIGNSRITNMRLHHPNGAYAYKINDDGKSIVFATDSEHHKSIVPKIIDFTKGADILIHDSQYTEAEYSGQTGLSRVGWGHSTYEAAVDIGIKAQVKTLVLFHHDPEHDDDFLDDILLKSRELASEKINVISAYEGLRLEI